MRKLQCFLVRIGQYTVLSPSLTYIKIINTFVFLMFSFKNIPSHWIRPAAARGPDHYPGLKALFSPHPKPGNRPVRVDAREMEKVSRPGVVIRGGQQKHHGIVPDPGIARFSVARGAEYDGRNQAAVAVFVDVRITSCYKCFEINSGVTVEWIYISVSGSSLITLPQKLIFTGNLIIPVTAGRDMVSL